MSIFLSVGDEVKVNVLCELLMQVVLRDVYTVYVP